MLGFLLFVISFSGFTLAQNIFMPLQRESVELLNAGPLSKEQIDLVSELNLLLTNPDVSKLSDVYKDWQKLKNTFPPNTTDIIDDWEQRRNELLQPALNQLEEIVKKTNNSQDDFIFNAFKQASTALSTGKNVPNITVRQYTNLQDQSLRHLANYSDIYMNVLTNLSKEFQNRTFATRNVTTWFVNLSALGPKIDQKLNETLYNMKTELSAFKRKWDNVTIAIRERANDLWNQTRQAAIQFGNEHPEIQSTWDKIKQGLNNFGNSVKNTWNNFLGLFRSKQPEPRQATIIEPTTHSSSLLKGAIQLAHLVATATSNPEKAAKKNNNFARQNMTMPPNEEQPRFSLNVPNMKFVDFTNLMCSMVSDISSVPQWELKRLFDLFDVDGDGMLSTKESEALNHVIIDEVNSLKCALIVVDFQNDFVNGTLAIKKGPAQQDPHEALGPLNTLLKENIFDMVVYTQDWHPANHISFYEHCRNPDRSLAPVDKSRKLRPFDTVNFVVPPCMQVLYPAHCVQNSWGAELCPHLTRVPSAKFIRKGLNVYVDAYSAFSDNNGEKKSELAMLLRSEEIDGVFICGLAYDICVAATTREASKLGFLTAVISDCSKGLDADKINETNVELSKKNVAIIDSTIVQQFPKGRKIPWKWICQLAGTNGNNTDVGAINMINSPGILNGNTSNGSLLNSDGIKV
uniref:EF-hand domain-containing protein n=1 Tax=Panagrolaimus sp. JU765 TaxID=591449 RepID=A0AC34QT11_9BILA